MMLRKVLTATAVATAMLATGGLTAPKQAAAETVLSMVYPFPDTLVYTISCKKMVEQLNEKGKGMFRIDLRPFNSIGMFEQPTAVTRGVVDMTCTPAAFYARGIPENEAISTSNASPEAVRANGGMAIIDELHQSRANMKYLGWIDSGVNFYVYMATEPKFSADGLPDFSGVKMRDNPIYGAFFQSLKAETHNMPSTEVYPALQTGVVNASGWTSIGLQQLKWDEFLTNRLGPAFYQTDIGVIMNLDTWKSLSPEAQKVIQDGVIAYEAESRAARMADAETEEKELAAKGMKFFDVPAADKYLEMSVESAFSRMSERVTQAGGDISNVEKLRAAYQQ